MEELCRQVPSFAGIQNLFDLAVAVALIRTNGLMDTIDWRPSLFLDDDRLPIQKYIVPTETRSLVNVKSVRCGLLLGKISGGVAIVPDRVISHCNIVESSSLPDALPLSNAEQKWWWD